MIVFVGGVVAGATGAFFSDTETSTGNTFAAGSLDLKVDSEAHYNGATCIPNANQIPEVEGDEFVWDDGSEVGWPIAGTPCDGTWAETDLGVGTTFFNLTDVKPGDEGENTISLHVYDNNAWGRFVIDNVESNDNTCTEPESDPLVVDPECNAESDTDLNNGEGELAETINFFVWLDQGSDPGFQCNDANSVDEGDACTNDPTEGDNIQQETEPTLVTPGGVDPLGETHNIWLGLAAVRAATLGCAAADPDGDGNNQAAGVYNSCHGLATDGRMVGSVTYYFGLGWDTDDVGNEAQTDSLEADLVFEVEQHRNNTTPFAP